MRLYGHKLGVRDGQAKVELSPKPPFAASLTILGIMSLISGGGR